MPLKNKKNTSKSKLNLNLAGSLLFWSGFLIFLFTFLPVAVQEIKFNFRRPDNIYRVATSADDAKVLKSEPKLTDTIITPTNFDFSLIIPKIGVNSGVFSNIDSGNPNIYLPILKRGVAHALGSSLPNQAGPVFIFAHSTDTFYDIAQYNAVFFLLNKLNTGDDIYIFYQGRQYLYQVSSKQIVDPKEIPSLVQSIKTNTLILQTCYPPGTTIKRLLVLANLK